VVNIVKNGLEKKRCQIRLKETKKEIKKITKIECSCHWRS